MSRLPGAERTVLAMIVAAGDAGLPAELEAAAAAQLASLERRGLVERGLVGGAHRLFATEAGVRLEASLRARSPGERPAAAWVPADLAAWQQRLNLSGAEAARRLGLRYATYREYLPTGRLRRDALPGWLPKLCTVIELAHRHATGEISTDELAEQLQRLCGPAAGAQGDQR